MDELLEELYENQRSIINLIHQHGEKAIEAYANKIANEMINIQREIKNEYFSMFMYNNDLRNLTNLLTPGFDSSKIIYTKISNIDILYAIHRRLNEQYNRNPIIIEFDYQHRKYQEGRLNGYNVLVVIPREYVTRGNFLRDNHNII